MTQPPARRIARPRAGAQAAEASPEPTPGYGTSRMAAKTRRALLMSSSKTEAHCWENRSGWSERPQHYRRHHHRPHADETGQRSAHGQGRVPLLRGTGLGFLIHAEL